MIYRIPRGKKQKPVPVEVSTFKDQGWSKEGMAHIRAASPGAAGRNRTLELNKLAEIPVPVPPIALQQTFSRLCNQLESAATLQRDFPAELEALQSSLLDQAFSGNL